MDLADCRSDISILNEVVSFLACCYVSNPPLSVWPCWSHGFSLVSSRSYFSNSSACSRHTNCVFLQGKTALQCFSFDLVPVFQIYLYYYSTNGNISLINYLKLAKLNTFYTSVTWGFLWVAETLGICSHLTSANFQSTPVCVS